ncbi:hypothetical protein evm_003226 [Chilo suppressalis]|nr:hypothetical protein evm_003226 [Chilo suppressalis]
MAFGEGQDTWPDRLSPDILIRTSGPNQDDHRFVGSPRARLVLYGSSGLCTSIGQNGSPNCSSSADHHRILAAWMPGPRQDLHQVPTVQRTAEIQLPQKSDTQLGLPDRAREWQDYRQSFQPQQLLHQLRTVSNKIVERLVSELGRSLYLRRPVLSPLCSGT